MMNTKMMCDKLENANNLQIAKQRYVLPYGN